MSVVPVKPAYRELIDAALAGGLDYTRLCDVARAEERPASDVLDELSCHVAQAYDKSEMTYQTGDVIMNAAFGVISSAQFRAEQDEALPELTFEVYQAFDEGEYFHRGDGKEVNPEEKYTKPLIKRFLSKWVGSESNR